MFWGFFNLLTIFSCPCCRKFARISFSKVLFLDPKMRGEIHIEAMIFLFHKMCDCSACKTICLQAWIRREKIMEHLTRDRKINLASLVTLLFESQYGRSILKRSVFNHSTKYRYSGKVLFKILPRRKCRCKLSHKHYYTSIRLRFSPSKMVQITR